MDTNEWELDEKGYWRIWRRGVYLRIWPGNEGWHSWTASLRTREGNLYQGFAHGKAVSLQSAKDTAEPQTELNCRQLQFTGVLIP